MIATKEESPYAFVLVKTRIAGNKLYVDMEIGIAPNLTVAEGHTIATNVHDQGGISDNIT